MVQREIKQIKAEIQSISSRKDAIDHHSSQIHLEVDSAYLFVVIGSDVSASKVEAAIDKWDRKLCREEGNMMKSIKSGARHSWLCK